MNWSLGANYSFVSNDFFEEVNIALNAPKNKFGANIQYTNPELGLGVGFRTRYVQGFPVRSGVYVGEVESYYTVDLNLGYDIPLGPKPRLSVTVQNLLDHKHQQFVGTPIIGRLAIARLTQTF
jgi:iron complex outermembrane receptor protein